MEVSVNPADQVYVSLFDTHFVTRYGPIVDPPVVESPPGFLGQREVIEPFALALDADENIWLAQRSLDRIGKFDSNGDSLLILGSPGTGLGQFDAPSGLAFDTSGNLFTTESGNSRVQKFDADAQVGR